MHHDGNGSRFESSVRYMSCSFFRRDEGTWIVKKRVKRLRAERCMEKVMVTDWYNTAFTMAWYHSTKRDPPASYLAFLAASRASLTSHKFTKISLPNLELSWLRYGYTNNPQNRLGALQV